MIGPLKQSFNRPSDAPPASLDSLWQDAQAAARALPVLPVVVDRLHRTAGRGAHGRKRPGSGDSFWQYRPFQSGDGAGDIDWRRSGRSQTLFVRQNEWETAQNIWLWADTSPSMAYRSNPSLPTKADRAAVLALASAKILSDAGERLAWYGAHDRTAPGGYAVRRLRAALGDARATPGGTGFPEQAAMRRHAHLILIGDFLSDTKAVEAGLAQLAGLAVRGHMLQVLDPMEMDFAFRGRVVLEGMEDEGEQLLGRAEDLREAYQNRLHGWCAHLGLAARQAGWTHSVHRTDQPAHMALLALVNAVGGG